MIEILFEIFFEGILELIIKSWTNFIKKKNPNYNNTRSKKIIIGIVKFLIVILMLAIVTVILFLIEWLLPNLSDIAGLG